MPAAVWSAEDRFLKLMVTKRVAFAGNSWAYRMHIIIILIIMGIVDLVVDSLIMI